MTRQGGLHKASLYALTWKEVNECDGKLDVGFGPTRVASGRWRDPVGPVPPARKRAPTQLNGHSLPCTDATLNA
jgi:hypothetical protein